MEHERPGETNEARYRSVVPFPTDESIRDAADQGRFGTGGRSCLQVESQDTAEAPYVVTMWQSSDSTRSDMRMTNVWLGLARVCAHAARRLRSSWSQAA